MEGTKNVPNVHSLDVESVLRIGAGTVFLLVTGKCGEYLHVVEHYGFAGGRMVSGMAWIKDKEGAYCFCACPGCLYEKRLEWHPQSKELVTRQPTEAEIQIALLETTVRPAFPHVKELEPAPRRLAPSKRRT